MSQTQTHSGQFLLRGVAPPYEKQLEIIRHLFNPDTRKGVKQIDLCCGRGFGKTVLFIIVAVKALSLNGKQVGLFLEPDWDSVNSIFLENWEKIVPSELYTINKGMRRIVWYNGSVLFYGPRNVTGSSQQRQDKQRGKNLNFIIDDEAAIGCDGRQYTNALAAIRRHGYYNFYLTGSTPKLGEYKKLISRPGHILYRGTSRDNPYLPDGYVDGLIAGMSADEVRREIDGEFVSLEGRIWQNFDAVKSWPNGNLNNEFTCFDPKRPWWLFCDFGSSTGAYAVIQQMDATLSGRRLFDGPVWVAVADYCPDYNANAADAFELLYQNFGIPIGIVGGADIETRSTTDGLTISHFANQVFGNVRLYPCNESIYNKQIQHDKLQYLICSALGHRRFTIARNFVSLDNKSERGIREMMEQDEWPDPKERNPSEFLPKAKGIMVQHIRDALLMGAAQIMSPILNSKNERKR